MFHGLRYINLEEVFAFTSVDVADRVGFYDVDTENHLFGVQAGYEIIKPCAKRCSIGAKTKLGGFLNFAEGHSVVVNDGFLELDNCDDEIGFALLGEFGVFTSYRVSPRFVLRAGYDLWYLWGVALATNQVDSTITSGTGTDLDNDGSLVVHGISAGAEFSW